MSDAPKPHGMQPDGTSEFRRYLFPLNHPRLADVRGLDPDQYRVAAAAHPLAGAVIENWKPLHHAEFRGVTETGELRPGLFPLAPPEAGEEAPVAQMVAAASDLLGLLDADGRSRLCHAVDAPEWQTWINPEFVQFDTGLRLEFETIAVRDAVMNLVAASLSPDGFETVRRTMRINGFLGQLVDLPSVLNEFSYHFAIYGDPHPVEPWGWQLFGHHCAVHCLVVAGRMQISPVFLGAEPDVIDEGPHAGPGCFDRRIELARKLMATLPTDQRNQAIQYDEMVDPAMPPDRLDPGDERHLAGAFRDNRVIPFEGACASAMPAAAGALLLDLVEEFVALLPDGPRRLRLREIEARLDETWVSWIGGWLAGDVFYARVQSPVILFEIDHHCGVFLDYDTPQPFHIHTVMRTPHGNDYGRSWVRQWRHGTSRP